MAEIERLTLVWDANFAKMNDKLDKVIRSNYGAAKKVEDAWNKNTVGKGVAKTFDDISRGALQATGPLNSFAGGLSKAGLAGAGTAAVLAGVALAFGQAKAAMSFADEISDTADRIHVSTDALQLYRYALREAGGEAANADKALESFSITLGNAQAGMPKAIKAFLQLGFTKDQVKSFKDTDDALRQVADRIAEISNPAQRDAVAERLGLGGLKQLLDKGSAGMDALLQKGRNLGVVMDSALLQRAADAQDEFETLSQIIDVQLKSAFIDVAPALIDLLKIVAQMAKLVGDIVDGFRSIENRSMRGLQTTADEARAQNTALLARNGGKPLTGSMKTAFEHNLGVIDRAQAEIDKRNAESSVKPAAGGRTLIDLSAGKGGGSADHDAKQREEREKRFETEILRLEDQILATSSDTSASIEERLNIEYARLELARQARDAEIDQLQADYKRSKGLEGLSDAEAAQLRELEDQLYNQKRNNARLDALRETRARLQQLEAQLNSFTLEQLQIAEGMATTQAERRRIQLRILDLEREQERKALEAKLKADKDVSEDQRNAALAGFDATTAARRGQVIAGTKSPLEKMRDEFPRTVEEINEAIESIEVNSLQSLNDILLDLPLNAKNAGEAFRRLASQIIADLARIALQQAEGAFMDAGGFKGLVSGLGNFLGLGNLFGGHRATGGPVDPRMAYEVGERGRELFVPNVAGAIIPNNVLKGLRAPSRAAPTFAIITPVHVHAEGSVGFKELVGGINGRIEQAHGSAVRTAVALAAKGMPGMLDQYRKLGGG